MLCLVCCIWLWFGQTGGGFGFGACEVVGYGLCFFVVFVWFSGGYSLLCCCFW